MTASIGSAVAPLFVPATRAHWIDKARASGTDAVIVDFEDAVAAEQRPAARATLGDYLDDHADTRIVLRINNDPVFLDDDLAFATRYKSWIAAIMLPKIQDTAPVARVAALGRPVWGLLESPVGLFALAQLVSVPGLARLGLGSVDFAQASGLDVHSAGGRAVLDQARAELVLRSAAADLAPPLNSPYTDFKDRDGLRAAATRAAGMGFGGMLCIHPSQVETVQQAFAPSAEQLAWAERVIAGAREHQGAFQLDGEMIDAPVLARAERLIASAPDH